MKQKCAAHKIHLFGFYFFREVRAITNEKDQLHDTQLFQTIPISLSSIHDGLYTTILTIFQYKFISLALSPRTWSELIQC